MSYLALPATATRPHVKRQKMDGWKVASSPVNFVVTKTNVPFKLSIITVHCLTQTGL